MLMDTLAVVNDDHEVNHWQGNDYRNNDRHRSRDSLQMNYVGTQSIPRGSLEYKWIDISNAHDCEIEHLDQTMKRK